MEVFSFLRCCDLLAYRKDKTTKNSALIHDDGLTCRPMLLHTAHGFMSLHCLLTYFFLLSLCLKHQLCQFQALKFQCQWEVFCLSMRGCKHCLWGLRFNIEFLHIVFIAHLQNLVNYVYYLFIVIVIATWHFTLTWKMLSVNTVLSSVWFSGDPGKCSLFLYYLVVVCSELSYNILGMTVNCNHTEWIYYRTGCGIWLVGGKGANVIVNNW